MGSTRVQGSDIAVASNGDVFIVFWFGGPQGDTGGRIGVRSLGGRRRDLRRSDPSVRWHGRVSGIASPLPNENFRTNTFPNVETDATRPGNVYVVAADDDDTPTTADASNIFFARSTNSGATWEPRVKLNDDGLDRHQCFPWMAVNDNGDILVLWYDTREDPNNHLLDVFYTLSTDGGTTWAPNQRLTTSFEPNTNQFSANYFFGDYIGAAGSGDHFHALWTDTRRPGSAPEQEVYYARIQPGVAAVASPAGPSPMGRVYPNPSSGSLHFTATFPTAGAVHVRVVDVTGRLVRELQAGRLSGASTRSSGMGAAPTVVP